VLAIEHLHTCNVLHRDLKPENVLLATDGHICLTDFGLAKETDHRDSERTLCGTSEYMAPEMLTRNGYGKAVDWWSLGALFFEMMVGEAPFTGKTAKEVERKILSEKVLVAISLSFSPFFSLSLLFAQEICVSTATRSPTTLF
jgi:p70 ribosomal S6 kinase